MQALKQNGVEKFSPLGDKFDPNMHSALFQIPDAEKEAGTVVVVTKVSYLPGHFTHRQLALCFCCSVLSVVILLRFLFHLVLCRVGTLSMAE